jgi:hypothetical protein
MLRRLWPELLCCCWNDTIKGFKGKSQFPICHIPIIPWVKLHEKSDVKGRWEIYSAEVHPS